MAVTNKAQIVAVMGSSGSGKSTYIKQQLRKQKPKRLIIVDPMEEYSEFGQKVNTLHELLMLAKMPTFKLIFTPSMKNAVNQFDMLCRIAYAAQNCWLVVEELSIYTKASWAPEGWANCSMRGRHKGMTIIGASQRPASIDKDFWGNASTVRTGRLNFKADIETLANILHVPKQDITALMPLEFIERDMNSGKVIRGKLAI